MTLLYRVTCTNCLTHKTIPAVSPVEAKRIAEAAGWSVGVTADKCGRCVKAVPR